MPDIILDLDIGNSFTKWRVLGVGSGKIANENIGVLPGLVGCQPSRIRISCVANDEFKTVIAIMLRKKFNCVPEFAEVKKSCAGMQNGYSPPDALGVDRWLAALTAWNQAGGNACLVIDAGSALTIDTIDEEGVFRGGYIIPGLTMMQRSLIGGAAKIACEVICGQQTDFFNIPTGTNQAVQRGAYFAMTAITEKAMEIFLLQWPRGTVCFTGGDGVDLAATKGMQERYKSDLVLDGLALALP